MAAAGGLAAPTAAFARLRRQGGAEDSGQEAQGEAEGGTGRAAASRERSGLGHGVSSLFNLWRGTPHPCR
ncbi:transcriptional regulator [Methylobacterium sp. ME121]|nr:transcriptional regulator [Methylobacterium sp. ME121]